MFFKNNKAFTLIELSSVILIIGFIVAGIYVGTEMIKIAQTKKIIHDVSSYQSAINAFVAQYEALPGDMSNASSFFGTTCDATPTNCNGNGDGIITYNTPYTQNEALRAWQLLYLAKFIDPTLTGIGQPDSLNNNKAVVSTNIPYANIKNAGYLIAPESTTIFWNNALIIGGQATKDINNFAGVPADESFMIDTKIDDGVPTTGRIKALAGVGDSTTCYDSSTPPNYLLANTGQSCRLFFFINISFLQAGGSF